MLYSISNVLSPWEIIHISQDTVNLSISVEWILYFDFGITKVIALCILKIHSMLRTALSQRKSKETWVCRNAFAPPKHSCGQITLLTFSHWKIPCSLSSHQTENGRLSFYLYSKELKYLEDNCNVNSMWDNVPCETRNNFVNFKKF